MNCGAHLYGNCISFTADELQREEDVLEWLVENKATGDEDDVIEEVNAKTLKTLIANIDNLVVLFCKFKNCFKPRCGG